MKAKFKGKFNGAGDVVCSLATSNNQLDRYIGKECEFKEFSGISYEDAKKKGITGWGRAGRQKIIGVQRIFNGNLAFRVVSLEYNDTFGRPARVNEVNILS